MSQASYNITSKNEKLYLSLTGDWRIDSAVPDFDTTDPDMASGIKNLHIVDDGVDQWDSMLMLFVMQCKRWADEHSILLDVTKMPLAVKKLLSVATAVAVYVPPDADKSKKRLHFFGTKNIRNTWRTLYEFLAFVGNFGKTLIKFLRGHSDTRRVDILYFIEQVGPKALGIITLVSILLGMILAYLGSVQLRQLGAQIYVADLVSIGMTREMGPLMTGIILAGRTGAAYAAQIGTMQVNDEVDAIKTMAMSSMEFLVLPRLLALILIMPLLVIYSNILGILGGAIIGTGMDISLSQYILETQKSIDLVDVTCGLIKSVFFAALVGIAGCQAGLNCGRNSTAVGHATTAAVVRAIVYLIAADAAFNVLYDKLGV